VLISALSNQLTQRLSNTCGCTAVLKHAQIKILLLFIKS